MNKNNYWFYLEPYVYISSKKNNVLLYNSLNGKIIQYKNKQKISEIIRTMMSPENSLLAKITNKELSNNEIIQFIEKVKKYFMGDLIPTSYSKARPVQMVPVLRFLQNKDQTQDMKGHNNKENLSELYIYINNECDQNCRFCKDYYKQFFCCYKGENNKKEIHIDQLKNFLGETLNSSLYYVNILGGNIFKHSKFKDMILLLNSHPFIKFYYVHYLNVKNQKKYLELLNNKLNFLNILVNFPGKKNKIEMILQLLKKYQIKIKLLFIVQQENEIELAENIISEYKVKEYSFYPFYNGKNLPFFEKNIFITNKEIEESKLILKEIFSRKILNPLNFGKLTVLCNGDIYANINKPKLGSLGKDSLYNILYKEMNQEVSWKFPREKVEPCDKCVYNCLCPPLSNYEIAIGKNNLCHIWK